MSTPLDFTLHRNAHGRLCLTDANGTVHVGITPVRAFPIEAPDEAISLVGADGKEVAWIDHVSSLSAPLRALLDEDFAVREFVPTIARIVALDSISVPSAWTVETDCGTTVMVLKAEEDIRKLPGHRELRITSRDGLEYRIADISQLDRHSKKLLERFL